MIKTTAYLVKEPSTNLLKITNPIESIFWDNAIDIRDKKEKPIVVKSDKEQGFITEKNIILVNNSVLPFSTSAIQDYNLLTFTGGIGKTRSNFTSFSINLEIGWTLKTTPIAFTADFTVPVYFTIVIFNVNAPFITANGGTATYFDPLLSIKVGDLIYNSTINKFSFTQNQVSKSINLLDTITTKNWVTTPEKITNNQLENIILNENVEKQFGHGIFFDKTNLSTGAVNYLTTNPPPDTNIQQNLTFNLIYNYNYTTI